MGGTASQLNHVRKGKEEMKESFWKKMKSIVLWGGGGAGLGAAVSKILGLTAVGLLGAGIGTGAPAVFVFAAAGCVIFLAILCIRKTFWK